MKWMIMIQIIVINTMYESILLSPYFYLDELILYYYHFYYHYLNMFHLANIDKMLDNELVLYFYQMH